MRRLLTLIACLLLPVLAAAQDRPNTILVLDGSGSMWGQIDGVNKIVIAREVVGVLLDDFPEDQNLGLTVYGHRVRGECTDIETVVAPGPGTLGDIRAAVDSINPRGMTPMTDAVIAAAEALRFTEQKATVILVSDGIETCNPDPCAAARALEEAGIDFTAHVVGFDVTDPEALAQMQCIAGETGGQFLEASNAAELSEALTTVAVAPEPEPEPAVTPVTFEARIGTENGEVIQTPVLWDVSSEIAAIAEGTAGNPLVLDLTGGSHTVTAYWVEQETASAPRQFIVTADPRTIVVVFEPPAVTASIGAPSTAVAGSTIEVTWAGPGLDGDFVGIGKVGQTGSGRWRNYTDIEAGSPMPLLVPPVPGPHLISYFDNATNAPLGSVAIEVLPAPVTLTAPSEAQISETFEVAWTGPDYEGDFIGIGKVGASGSGQWENFAYTVDGSPALVLAPGTAGDYVLGYFMSQDNTLVASVPITVTEAQVSLTAPASAVAGTMIEVVWTGPNGAGDFIGIGAEGASGSGRYRNFTYTEAGSPLMLEMPPVAGSFVISYFLDQDNTVLVSRPIEIVLPAVLVIAPATAIGGTTIEVAWTGPDGDGDFIGIGLEGASGSGRYRNFAYTADGSPAQIVVPPETGSYVISYFLDQDNTVLVSTPIAVTKPEATLTAPATAIGGSTIEVAWTGPNGSGDFIGIGEVGNSGSGRYTSFAYTADGPTLPLTVPVRGGDYLLSYFLDQDNTVIASVPVAVTTPPASVSGPASAPAGTTIEVSWTGPNYPGDFIGVGKLGQSGSGQWRAFAYTEAGSPAVIELPEDPGDYVIQYFTDFQRVGLAEARITLE